jgi:hypothetical protein
MSSIRDKHKSQHEDVVNPAHEQRKKDAQAYQKKKNSNHDENPIVESWLEERIDSRGKPKVVKVDLMKNGNKYTSFHRSGALKNAGKVVHKRAKLEE